MFLKYSGCQVVTLSLVLNITYPDGKVAYYFIL